ncbi:MAG: ABC transporter permease [Thermomicrobiales bacterium]|nr:ABC transporter permease [Thermomicrobiales bacterium]MCO5220711.1 ABC transporter permease [Thermomicrobiales bacterium]
MARYLLGRFLQSIMLLLIVSMVVFVIIHKAPGMPAVLVDPDSSSGAQIEQARANLGLDDPIAVQYLRWLRNAVQGNFGYSYQLKTPVLDLVLERLPASLLLSGSALLLATLIALPVGIWCAVRPKGIVDTLSTLGSFVGVSIPVFWFGLLAMMLFSVRWGLLPTGGMKTLNTPFSLSDRIEHLILPAVVLSLVPMAQLLRYTRSSMRSVMRQDYLRTARSKGLSEQSVLARHALRNALIPVVTVFGLLLPATVSGAPVTEAIFSWPGMGRLAVDAAFQRDYPVIMGVTLVVSTMVIVTNLLVDIAYAILDPRIELH